MACWPRTQTVCYDLKHSLFKVWPAPAVNNHRLRFDFQLLQAGSLPLCRTVQWTGFHYCRPNTQETFWVDQAAAAWSHSSAEQSMHCLPARGVKSLHSGPSLVVVSGTAGPDRRLHGLIFFYNHQSFRDLVMKSSFVGQQNCYFLSCCFLFCTCRRNICDIDATFPQEEKNILTKSLLI